MFRMIVVISVRNLAQIKLRKQHKNKGLNESDKDAQRHQENRNDPMSDCRIKAGDCMSNLFIGKHVSEKTNTERKRADEVTNQLNRKNQRTNPPDWPPKMFEVSEESILLNADPVVIKKRRETECKGDTDGGGWRHEQREHAHQI